MTFYQTHTVDEYLFGPQTIRFAVSDNYNELFAEVGTNTDIFILESIKEDLNTDEGSFAIDELNFSINHLSCQSDDDLKAMYFCLDASDVKANRYVAVFMDVLPGVSDMLFIGKLSDKISGQDKLWNAGNYLTQTDAKREYKFTAYSFDAKILEIAKLKERIYKNVDGEDVLMNNVIDRFKANNLAECQSLFKQKIFFWRDTIAHQYCYFEHLGNLYDIMSKILEFAHDIILEKEGIDLIFNLLPSELSIACRPAQYEYRLLTLGGQSRETWKVEVSDTSYKLKFNAGIAPATGYSFPFINIKMLDPGIFTVDESGEDINLSFLRNQNVSELLYDIARSFACYIFITYTSGSSLNIELKSRSGLVEQDYTYIIGADEASLDTSSIATSGKNQYYAVACKYADEYLDAFKDKEYSQNLDASSKAREYQKKRNNLNFESLLFSGSPTLRAIVDYSNNAVAVNPINSCFKDTLTESFDLSNYIGTYGLTPFEYLHTSLYIPIFPAIESEVAAQLPLSPVLRPVGGFLTKINGEDRQFNRLSDLANELMARDKQYYETEYTLSVPFWNGYSKNPDGSNPSWKNIKRGSKIKLSEIVKRYDTQNGWIETVVQRDFVVVGIERNLQKPETKLKLHNLSRFAYGYWEGSTEDLIPGVLDGDSSLVEEGATKDFIIDSGESISSGDAVQLLITGKIGKGINTKERYGKTIGIALSSGNEGESVSVKVNGLIVNDNFNFGLTKPWVFLRRSNSGSNLSQQALPIKTENEDSYIYLGKVTSVNSFVLEIREYLY